MKRSLLFLLIISPAICFSQIVDFWTEDFGFGCNSAQQANGWFSISTSGSWTVNVLGTEAEIPNNWFISAEENGNEAGECGSACGNDPSLHIGAEGSLLGTDLGASYYECDGSPLCMLFGGNGATHKRVESPVINCSGIGNATLSFVYIEGGNNIDNCTLWYYDGATWSLLVDLPKTDANACAPQGIWTSYSIALPSSSNNNTDVRIGFQWINNDDGIAADPSFAVDDIVVSGEFAVDLVPPEVLCPPDLTVFTDDWCAIMENYASDAIVNDDVDPFPLVTQTPPIGDDLLPGDYPITITATDNSGNSNSCTFLLTVVDDDAPEITCPDAVTVQIPDGETEANVTVPLADASDNCTLDAVSNDYNNTPDASDVYPVGATVVTFEATDASGNATSCTTTVNVVVQPSDCCLGDFNCDGYISVLDLLYIIEDFGCLSNCYPDLDGNGAITVVDLQIFSGLYGTVCP